MSEPAIGHNSDGQLKSIVDRVEALEEDKAGLADDIKGVYAEAKSNGFDVKILRKVIRLRKQDKAKRDEEIEMTERYLHSLGMI